MNTCLSPEELQKVPKELLPWAWAVSARLQYFYDHDQKLLEAARNNWGVINASGQFPALNQMLRAYGLRRGKSATYFKNHSLDFVEVGKELFSRQLPAGDAEKWEQAQERWLFAVRELKRLARKKGHSAPRLWSATCKAYWFYHPSELTMYDQYAQGQLSIELGDQIGPEDFLVAFGEFWQTKAQKPLAELFQYISKASPHQPRIADGYLWLLGKYSESELEDIYKDYVQTGQPFASLPKRRK